MRIVATVTVAWGQHMGTYRRWFWGIVLAWHSFGVWACGPATMGEDKPLAITAEALRPHVEFLADPKRAGRAGAAKAESRRYIIDQWKSIGLTPLFPPREPNTESSFEQEIPAAAADGGPPAVMGHNLGAVLEGTDAARAAEIVIVSAHYDHLGVRNGQIYPGADDNASGVAMMLEVARQLSQPGHRPRRTLVFLAFDLEENLLWGSRWFAAHPPWPMDRVKFFLTADMIGRSLGDLPLPAVFVIGAERSTQVRDALNQTSIPEGLEVCQLGTDMVGTRSDYGAFRDREIPYLFFSTGEHPDYHTPADTPDRVDYAKAARISTLILRLSARIANHEEPPVWNVPGPPDLEEPRVLLRITTLLLEADQRRPLTSTQRFLVTNVHQRAKRILEAGKVSTEDRAWLVRMAQALLVSVF